MKQSVEYIKISQISKREFEVSCVVDGEIQVDGSFKDSVTAEKRVAKLANMYNCDWGCDY